MTDGSAYSRSPRLWPGMAIVILQWLIRFGQPVFAPDQTAVGMMAGLAGGLVLVIWWIFFSRVSWSERFGVLGMLALGLIGTSWFLHESMATGAMGLLYWFYVVPTVSLALVAWAWATRSFPSRRRWLTLTAAIVLASGSWALVKTGGFTGSVDSEFSWRWSATAEDRLLAAAGREQLAPPVALERGSKSLWPGFRGSRRDSVVRGIEIDPNWAASPPVERWRRSVGPGWSSFAVGEGLIYTQEQRGEDETVSCYRLETGAPVWRHTDPLRFWESNAGPGPRATPTLADGRLFTLGATGLVNALDARDGSPLWSRDAAADSGASLPSWGFSGSPLVHDGLVVVAASGALVAYDAATGTLRWQGPVGGEAYSSPHLVTLDGVEQIVQLHGEGVVGIDHTSGTRLWEHSWDGFPMVQPALTADGDLLVSIGDNKGIRRLSVRKVGPRWNVEERWTTRGLKPNFNDFVVHQGNAYGFDGRILSSIDLESGERNWKGGRYGNGQLLLLADQHLLLVLSEKGELALVGATPNDFSEVARLPMLEGKTWNHPVILRDMLLVRNGEEMAGLELRRLAP